jgi:hypothetical protein
MTDETPATVDYTSPCDLCGEAATWRSTPKLAETEFTARVIACVQCCYTFVEPWKARYPDEAKATILGWLAERIAG